MERDLQDELIELEAIHEMEMEREHKKYKEAMKRWKEEIQLGNGLEEENNPFSVKNDDAAYASHRKASTNDAASEFGSQPHLHESQDLRKDEMGSGWLKGAATKASKLEAKMEAKMEKEAQRRARKEEESRGRRVKVKMNLSLTLKLTIYIFHHTAKTFCEDRRGNTHWCY